MQFNDNVSSISKEQTKEYDNLAPIRQIFDKYTKKCRANYEIDEFCTVDAMLLLSEMSDPVWFLIVKRKELKSEENQHQTILNIHVCREIDTYVVLHF